MLKLQEPEDGEACNQDFGEFLKEEFEVQLPSVTSRWDSCMEKKQKTLYLL